MMKYILTILLCLSVVTAFAQDATTSKSSGNHESEELTPAQKKFYDIIGNCVEVIDKDKSHQSFLFYANDDTIPDRMSVSNIEDILNMDAVRFYGLKGYDTELKRQLFKESEEYKTEYYPTLLANKEFMLSTNYFYIIPFSSNYDMTNKAFPLSFEVWEGEIPNVPNYLVRKDLCFDFATKRFPKHKMEKTRRFGGRDYFINQKIYLNVPDLKEAAKIEDAKSDKALLIIFKLDSVFKARPGIFEETYLKTKIQSLYIINTKTVEVMYKVL